MQRERTILVGALASVIALAAVTFAGGAAERASASGTASGNPAVTSADPCAFPTTGKTREIATAKLIIEFNATDDDIGVHGAFDDDGWKRLCVFDPTGRPVLHGDHVVSCST